LTTALVLGGARNIWADVEAALELGEFDGVVGCNDIGACWPGVMDAWVSLHGSHFVMWCARRELRGRPPHKAIYSHAAGAGEPANNRRVDHFVPYQFEGQDRSGSSGLFALKVALIDLGFDKAVLCGIPMTEGDRHFFDPRDWDAALAHRQGWVQALPVIKDRARSMSGWTREILGAPTAEWLDLMGASAS
jgi:hypothetical protein